MGAVGDHSRAADLEDQLFPVLLLLALQGLLELFEAVGAEAVVRRPVGLVERPSSGVDGPVHVLFRRVGHLPERLLGCGVEVGEGAGLAVDQLAVDHHLRLEADLYSVSHVCWAFVIPTFARQLP